ncbi:hypothetical protein JQN72_07255 [Phycicoccus sp. CSK15P-2]|uniref:WYL domain-containing protein n=1 Tax=Phycicoccus sp. CSK15P-2 TaxID=2807627 RepID=UPI00194EE812|nr:hypothetical protein [Phycicoccus sp. CSK15P-2]MBM6404037.1 hypothetical protein [Phycicoccus sp. CSK15P-2]
MALRRLPSADETVDSDALCVLVSACRDHEAVRFEYLDRSGEHSHRLVEPHQLDALVMTIVGLALRASVHVVEPSAVAGEVAAVHDRLGRR